MAEPMQSIDSSANPVLDFSSASYVSSKPNSLNLSEFTSQLQAKHLVEIRLNRQQDAHELIELIVGLRQPEKGQIRVQGLRWDSLQYDHLFKLRSRIGRVFAGPAWIQNLTVGDNIRLAAQHHKINVRNIAEQLEYWTMRLAGPFAGDIKRSMRRRPAFVQEHLLQIGQLIRALINEPQILILERPHKALPDEVFQPFALAVSQICNAGATVLWFTDKPLDGLPETAHQRLWQVASDNTLVERQAA